MNVIKGTKKGTYNINVPENNSQKTYKVKNYRSHNLGIMDSPNIYIIN